MNFRPALAATTPDARARLVRDEIAKHSWGDRLGGLMQQGGWPERETVRDVRIREDDRSIVATVEVAWIESTPAGCSLYVREHDGAATFEVRIDRTTGEYAIERTGSDAVD